MRILQKLVVIALGVFISIFFIPTAWNLVCNGGTGLVC